VKNSRIVLAATAALALLLQTASVQAQTEWTLFQPEGAGYRIEFPGTPTVKRDSLPSRAGPAPHLEATLSYANNEYAVELTTYASPSPPEAVLDLLVNAWVKNFAKIGHLRGQTPLKIGALPARRVEMELFEGQDVATVLFVTDGTRVFEVRCFGPTGTERSANVTHFINSFALVPQ
jgi:hypothetical protein